MKERKQQFEALIARIPEMVECFSTIGEVDYIVRIVAPDFRAASTVMEEHVFRLPAQGKLRQAFL